jgi:TolB-like protein
MKYLLTFILAILVFPFNADSSGSDFNIAIIDLEGVGADYSQCSIASDKIRNVLLQNSSFKVMERNVMQEILREQGFQQTGTCNSTSCIIEAGQLLGVRYLLAGKLSRTEGLIALSLRVIDVRTGLILSSDGFETNNEYPQFLSTELPPFTKRFVETTKNAIEESMEKGSLYVESTPISGKISIDGKATSQVTPATFNNISSGVHTIIVSTPDSIGQISVDVKKNDLVKSLVVLKMGFGSIMVQSVPPNAAVVMDGRKLTETPMKKDSIPAGKYQIRVFKPGHIAVIDTVAIAPNALTKRVYNLVLLSFIKFVGIDRATSILLDEKPASPDNNGLITATAGKHSLNASSPGNKAIMFKVDLAGGDTSQIILKWEALESYLSISTVPVQALIKIGDDSIATTPTVDLPLTSGEHSIYLHNKMYNDIKHDILLIPGQSLTLSDTFISFSNEYLTWKAGIDRARYFNFLFSGLGDIFAKQPLRGSELFAVGISSDALCGIALYQYFSHKSLLKSATLPDAKQYYTNRISEDKSWIAGTFTLSLLLRLFSYYLTSNIQF